MLQKLTAISSTNDCGGMWSVAIRSSSAMQAYSRQFPARTLREASFICGRKGPFHLGRQSASSHADPQLYSTTRLVTRTSSKIRADDTPAPSTSTVVLPQASSSKAPTTGNFHHRLSVTSAVLSEDGSSMYTSSKEGTILRWSLDFAAPSTVPSSSSQPRKLLLRQRGSITQTKPKTPAVKTKVKGKGKAVASRAGIEGHTDEVWCLALSGDDRYLVSGGKEGRACVWDVHTQERGAKYVKAFDRHRDSISVRPGSSFILLNPSLIILTNEKNSIYL